MKEWPIKRLLIFCTQYPTLCKTLFSRNPSYLHPIIQTLPIDRKKKMHKSNSLFNKLSHIKCFYFSGFE